MGVWQRKKKETTLCIENYGSQVFEGPVFSLGFWMAISNSLLISISRKQFEYICYYFILQWCSIFLYFWISFVLLLCFIVARAIEISSILLFCNRFIKWLGGPWNGVIWSAFLSQNLFSKCVETTLNLIWFCISVFNFWTLQSYLVENSSRFKNCMIRFCTVTITFFFGSSFYLLLFFWLSV